MPVRPKVKQSHTHLAALFPWILNARWIDKSVVWTKRALHPRNLGSSVDAHSRSPCQCRDAELLDEFVITYLFENLLKWISMELWALPEHIDCTLRHVGGANALEMVTETTAYNKSLDGFAANGGRPCCVQSAAPFAKLLET